MTMITTCTLCKEPVYSPLEIYVEAKPIHIKISLCSFKCLGAFQVIANPTTCLGILSERVKVEKKEDKEPEKDGR